MKTRKVMSCAVSSCDKLIKRIGTQHTFTTNIDPSWGPLHFVRKRRVTNVSTLILHKSQVLVQMFFNISIKFIELYGTVESILKSSVCGFAVGPHVAFVHVEFLVVLRGQLPQVHHCVRGGSRFAQEVFVIRGGEDDYACRGLEEGILLL